MIISKGQTPKIHRSIVNVSVNVSETCTELPREESYEEIIIVKKFSFKGHVYSQPVRSHKVKAALEYLQRVNPLYYDILIIDGDINQDLLAVGINLPKNDIDFDVESDNELECTTNPLSAPRHAANESLAINNENLLEPAPGTRHILFDD